MMALSLVVLALAYLFLLFWIVIAVQETTKKYLQVPMEARHISVKKGRQKRYVVKFN